MFDFNLKKKMMSYMPYGAILYLLCGGAGMPGTEYLDMGVADYVVEQVEPKAEGTGLKGLYNKVVGNKAPNEGNLPGKASFSGAQKRTQPQENMVNQFLRAIVNNIPRPNGGTNYGY
jgi:hypothetical protein